MKSFFLLLFSFALLWPAAAQVKLPRLVRDSMVLQRGSKVNIWGWAAKGEKVAVRFNGKRLSTTTRLDGKWSVSLPPMKAGGPYTMEIAGSNRIILKDILIGDVWLCAGQSNMVHQMELHKETYATEIKNAHYPLIRHFAVPTLTHLQGPQQDLPSGYWKSATPEDVGQFSAVAYFFAKNIFEKHGVPIGLINASVGGTPIEAWTSEEGLALFDDVVKTINQNKDTAYVNSTNQVAFRSNEVLRNRGNADKGLAEPVKWSDTLYQPKGWRNISIPGYWEDQGIRNLDGIVWYRKEVEIPASMTGIPAKVYLGRIVDADILYVNGVQAGQTTYQYPQRRCQLPAGMLKPGKNILVVRVTNQSGKGGFVPDKPYRITAGDQTIDLKGSWQYKVGEVFLPQNSAPGISAQNQPAALYNGMVAPLVNYAVKGILWYQGESNAGKPNEYAKLLPAIIKDWRKQWNQESLPFLIVQLPNFMEVDYLPSESNWALMREAQTSALSLPHTAMAVTIDLGEWNDIHPDNKKDVGVRLALAARKLVYGESLVSSGPVLEATSINDDKIVLSFSNTGTGLITNDGEAPGSFAIAGADKKFIWAHAKIKGNKVVVWNEAIAKPMYVRYAWADNPHHANLYNKEGLPAAPFRTDNQSPNALTIK